MRQYIATWVIPLRLWRSLGMTEQRARLPGGKVRPDMVSDPGNFSARYDLVIARVEARYAELSGPGAPVHTYVPYEKLRREEMIREMNNLINERDQAWREALVVPSRQW